MDLWVIDTCSITEVRRGLIPGTAIAHVYIEMTRLADAGSLVYPKQVVGELEEYTGSTRVKPDLPYTWAKQNEAQGTRFGFDPENLKRVLANPIARRVVDTAKTGQEEADPYILEVATRLQGEGHRVVVVTEDRKDKPMKLSLHSACGALRVVPMNIEVFLASHGIWRRGPA